MDVYVKEKLNWAFTCFDMWGGLGGGLERKTNEQRKLEKPLLDFLTKWFLKVRHQFREFIPFDDPRDVPSNFKMINTPIDAVDTLWEIGIELKSSNTDWGKLVYGTGGFWMQQVKVDHFRRLCGVSSPCRHPLLGGWVVYYRPEGTVYAMSVSRFEKLKKYNDELSPDFEHLAGRYPAIHDTERCRVTVDPTHSSNWVVPVRFWARLGNYRTGELLSLPDGLQV